MTITTHSSEGLVRHALDIVSRYRCPHHIGWEAPFNCDHAWCRAVQEAARGMLLRGFVA